MVETITVLVADERVSLSRVTRTLREVREEDEASAWNWNLDWLRSLHLIGLFYRVSRGSLGTIHVLHTTSSLCSSLPIPLQYTHSYLEPPSYFCSISSNARSK